MAVSRPHSHWRAAPSHINGPMKNEIVIAGLPGSGNYMTKALFDAAGISCAIAHNGENLRRFLRDYSKVIVLHRLMLAQEGSVQVTGHMRSLPGEHWQKCTRIWQEMLPEIAGREVFLLAYEQLVAAPATMATQLLMWAGHEPGPECLTWAGQVADQNEKYLSCTDASS